MHIEFFCDKCGWFTRERIVPDHSLHYTPFKSPTTCGHCRDRLAAVKLEKARRKSFSARLRDAIFGEPTVYDHISMHVDEKVEYEPMVVRFPDCRASADSQGRVSLHMVYDERGQDPKLTVKRLEWLFDTVGATMLIFKWKDRSITINQQYSSDSGPRRKFTCNGGDVNRAELQTFLDTVWLTNKFYAVTPEDYEDYEDLRASKTPIRVGIYNICTESRCPNQTVPPECSESQKSRAKELTDMLKGVEPIHHRIDIKLSGNLDALAKTMKALQNSYWSINVSGKNRTFSGLTATDDGPQQPRREGSKDAEPRTEASPFVDSERLKVVDLGGRVIGHAVLDREICSAVDGVPGAFSMGYKVEGSVGPKVPVAVEHAIFRSRFEGWVLSIKHPVLGFLDRHWFDRSDDGEGYVNEYVQGLWVAAQAFSHHVDDNGVVAHRIRYLDGDRGPWRDGPPDYGDEMDAAERVIDGFQCAYNKPWPDGFFICLPPQEAFANWGVYQAWRMDEMRRYQESGVTLLTTLPAKWRG